MFSVENGPIRDCLTKRNSQHPLLSSSLAQVAPEMKDTMVSFISLMQRNNKKNNNSKLPPQNEKKHKEQTKEQAPPLSGEWKPASYVAVTAFVILALALCSGTAYDLFNRWVIVSNVNIIKPDSLKIKKLRHHLFFCVQNLYLCPSPLTFHNSLEKDF